MSNPLNPDECVSYGSLVDSLLGNPLPRPMPPGLGTSLLQAAPPEGIQGQSPRVSPENVELMTKMLSTEVGDYHKYSPQEFQAVGSTAINRMNRDGTDQLSDVVRKGQYAFGKAADPRLRFTAYRLLSGQLGDSTGG